MSKSRVRVHLIRMSKIHSKRAVRRLQSRRNRRTAKSDLRIKRGG